MLKRIKNRREAIGHSPGLTVLDVQLAGLPRFNRNVILKTVQRLTPVQGSMFGSILQGQIRGHLPSTGPNIMRTASMRFSRASLLTSRSVSPMPPGAVPATIVMVFPDKMAPE